MKVYIEIQIFRHSIVAPSSVKWREFFKYLHDVFEANGYPSTFIHKALKQRTQSHQAEEATARDEVTYAKVPYVAGVSEKIAKLLRPKGIQVAHSSRRLRNHLVNVKDRIEPEKKKGIVYKIQCSCGSNYIGESGRPKNVRLKEHVADIKFARLDKSATARHFAACAGDMNPLDAKTIATEDHWRKRKIREAIEIRQSRSSINLDEGGLHLSPIWDILLGGAR